MSTYKFKQTKDGCLLISNKNKYRVYVVRHPKDHLWVRMVIRGTTRVQGLTSIKSQVSQFEIKVVALHFYKIARENRLGPPSVLKNALNENYTGIFGSCFD